MTDKTNLETFKRIIENNTDEYILSQTNTPIKQRHGGIAIKFSKKNVNNKRILISDNANDSLALSDQILPINDEEIVSDILGNSDTNQTLITSIIEENEENYKQYRYGVLTFAGNQKVVNITKKIINLKEKLKLKYEKNNFLEINISNIRKNIQNKIEEYIQINSKLEPLNKKVEGNKKINNTTRIEDLNEYFSHKYEKQRVSKLGVNFEKEINKLKKEKWNNKIKIKKIENNIKQLKQQKIQIIEEINVPLSLKNKINKKIELQQKIYETENRDEDKRIDLLENIFILKKQIKEDINYIDKYVEKIYEEILLIDDKFCLITTFVHADESIIEKIIYFHYYKDNYIEMFNQRKTYKDISEYKNDLLLIEKIPNNNKNIFLKKIQIKDFLNKLNNKSNWKISIPEWVIYGLILLLSLTLLATPVGIASFIPSAMMLGKAVVGVIGVGIAWFVNKGLWSLVSDKTKKVEALMKKNFYSLMRKIPGLKNIGKTREEEETKKM